MALTEKHIQEVTAYIQKWGPHLDEHFGGVELEGKRLLIVGSGWGSEVLWALKRGAREVVGIDPRSAERIFIEGALAQQGLSHLGGGRFALHQGTTLSVGDLGAFDVVISNNTFEHVDHLSANLAAIARFLPQPGGRIHIFADPLYHSSLGHHMPVGPWEHFSLSQEALRAKVSPLQWREYSSGLNGMTLTGFLGGVREAGLILLALGISPDRNIGAFNEIRPTLPVGLKPMDLCLSGISCTLAFPHNL